MAQNSSIIRCCVVSFLCSPIGSLRILKNESFLSSPAGAAMVKQHALAPEARTILALGGAETLEGWWQEDVSVVHAAMGQHYSSLVDSRQISAQVMHWEPCENNKNSTLKPLPFGRWAIDAVIMVGHTCIEGIEQSTQFAFEVDRIVRPGGSFIAVEGHARDVLSTLQSVEGTAWGRGGKLSHDGLQLHWASRPTWASERLQNRNHCSSADENEFCTTPATMQTNCVFDLNPSCPNHSRHAVRANWQEIDGAISAGANFWAHETWYNCTLPKSFKLMNREGHRRYFGENNLKEFEWSCGDEHERVEAGLENLEYTKSCKNKTCFEHNLLEVLLRGEKDNLEGLDSKKEEQSLFVLAGTPIRRVLDAGAGSCSLSLYLRQHIESHYPAYKKLAILGFDQFYYCGFAYVCSERAVPVMAANWLNPVEVPDNSMDMVFQAQGLHHLTDDDENIRISFDHLSRPLRPGGLLHLSDLVSVGHWATLFPLWASEHGYMQIRSEVCMDSVQFLYQKPI